MDLQNACYGPYCLGKGGFLTLLVAFTLEGLIGLINALAESGRLDIPTVGIYLARKTGCVGQRSWRTTKFILFDWQLLLVLSLLGVSGEEEIMFKF